MEPRFKIWTNSEIKAPTQAMLADIVYKVKLRVQNISCLEPCPAEMGDRTPGQRNLEQIRRVSGLDSPLAKRILAAFAMMMCDLRG
jgi:hypothetical protein